MLMESGKKERCEIETRAEFDVVEPFSFSATCLTTKFTPVAGQLFSDESFLVQTSLRIISPWPIFLHCSSFQEVSKILNVH